MHCACRTLVSRVSLVSEQYREKRLSADDAYLVIRGLDCIRVVMVRHNETNILTISVKRFATTKADRNYSLYIFSRVGVVFGPEFSDPKVKALNWHPDEITCRYPLLLSLI